MNNRHQYFQVTETLETLVKENNTLNEQQTVALNTVIAERKQFTYCSLCTDMTKTDNGICLECGCQVGYLDPYAD